MSTPVQSATDCEIHPDDEDLVREADINWFCGMSLSDLVAMEFRDNVNRHAAFLKYLDDGLSGEAAGRKVAKYFPMYAGTLEEREEHPRTGDDASLPYHIHRRVTRAAYWKFDRAEVEAATSMNAYIRRLIRENRLPDMGWIYRLTTLFRSPPSLAEG